MNTIKCVISTIFVLLLVLKTQAQCNIQETITVCDMTVIDGDTNGTPDGIINLYDAYNALPGVTPISLATGTWFDPDFNFALDEASGDLYLWDLDNSSENITDYQFQLIDTSSSCTDGILINLSVVLGPFEGNPLPPSGPNAANVTICEAVLSSFDLFQVFESQPSAHKNGTWAFVGNLGDPSNFLGLTQDGRFSVRIPYVPGGNLIEFDVFEFTYTVPGMNPCSASVVSNFKVEVIRDVKSGEPNTFEICETDILSGLWDTDIDLRDDRFLFDEDIEGTWQSFNDITGQVSGPLDSTINIREIYDDLKSRNPRFNCEEFSFRYTVEARSSLTDCTDKMSDVVFRIYEPIKPFQQDDPLEICVDEVLPNTINLYDQITFTTENGELYDYPQNSGCITWDFISGPSDLGFLLNPGFIDTTNITNADAGTYTFRYNVSAACNSCSSGGTSPCNSQSTFITVIIHPKNYAGEDTFGLEFCENDPIIAAPLDLFTLLGTNGVDDPVYQGAMGAWVDNATGNTILNPITLPQINNQQQFNFTYSTTTSNGCIDRADLSFTVYEEYQSGAIAAPIDVCDNNAGFDLFDRLTGSPNTNGVWTGPNGFTTTGHNALFNPASSEAGVYTYTVPDNTNGTGTIICSGNTTAISVIVHQSPNAGMDMQSSVCRSDSQIDLNNYLDANADSGGTFIDLDTTNALTGHLLNVSQLDAGVYNFQYEIQGHTTCNLSTALVEITIIEVAPPITNNQTFCASDGATVLELQASNGVDFNWYDSIDAASPLPIGTVLEDGENYFVSALDSNSCESERIQMQVSLLPIDHVDCDDCIKDGISPNGDNENDEFDLCNLPVTFPDFEINIYNRYGSIVYKGNKNTPLFKGVSNVPLTIGKNLPSGIYFYVFDPKDGTTTPFQGNFYLSR